MKIKNENNKKFGVECMTPFAPLYQQFGTRHRYVPACVSDIVGIYADANYMEVSL